MKARSISLVIPARRVNMGGHLLDQPLPTNQLEQLDPFLLIHHWENTLPGGQRENEAGVGSHPHRGFSPVTFVFKGEVVHRDSLGEKATVGAGGTQWMFAGRGITHSERFSKDLTENGGELEFIQFWVNTPSEHKMKQPFYLPISKDDTPIIKKNGYEIAVVSGDLNGVVGPAKTYTPQLLLRGSGQAGAKVSVNIPSNHNTLIYS